MADQELKRLEQEKENEMERVRQELRSLLCSELRARCVRAPCAEEAGGAAAGATGGGKAAGGLVLAVGRQRNNGCRGKPILAVACLSFMFLLSFCVAL